MRARIAMIGRRAYAASAVCSAVLHGVSLGHGENVAVELLILTMAAACLYCAYDIWTRGTVRAWVLVASMNLAMIGVHLPMSLTHRHGGGVSVGHAMPQAMALATALAVVEAMVAAVVSYYRTQAWAPGDSIRQPPVGSEVT